MSEQDDVHERNKELAQLIYDELLRDPHHPYLGKWIGIVNGQVVVLGDSWDEVRHRLDEIEPDLYRTYIMKGVGEAEDEELACYGDSPVEFEEE